MPGELCLQFDSNDSVTTSHIDMTVTKESIIPKVIGSRFRVQGSKVIVYFTRVPGSGFRVDNL